MFTGIPRQIKVAASQNNQSYSEPEVVDSYVKENETISPNGEIIPFPKLGDGEPEAVNEALARIESQLNTPQAQVNEQIIQEQNALTQHNTGEIYESPYPANTVTIGGRSVPFADAHGVARAPESGAGIWSGSGAIDDGLSTHFIGHNPGDFDIVMQLSEGDVITVTNEMGQARDYHVYWVANIDDYVVDEQGVFQYDTIFNQPGESISLQTCITDFWNRIVLAR